MLYENVRLFVCLCVRLFFLSIHIFNHLTDFQGTFDVDYAIEVTPTAEFVIS
jgi:hypothetical protein